MTIARIEILLALMHRNCNLSLRNSAIFMLLHDVDSISLKALVLSGLFMREKRLVEFMRQSGGDATPKVLSEVFSVSDRTLQRWAQGWIEQGILQPASGMQRITRYRLTEKYK